MPKLEILAKLIWKRDSKTKVNGATKKWMTTSFTFSFSRLMKLLLPFLISLLCICHKGIVLIPNITRLNPEQICVLPSGIFLVGVGKIRSGRFQNTIFFTLRRKYLYPFLVTITEYSLPTSTGSFIKFPLLNQLPPTRADFRGKMLTPEGKYWI